VRGALDMGVSMLLDILRGVWKYLDIADLYVCELVVCAELSVVVVELCACACAWELCYD
jgi:hypothetical protein